eukprot:scaffold93922_cov24-Prasinocladus_malaysianus.AAC.1
MPRGTQLPGRGESWVVWSYGALEPGPPKASSPSARGSNPKASDGFEGTLLGRLWRQLEMTGFSLSLLSPEAVRWQTRVYFAFMADAVRLGLAPK